MPAEAPTINTYKGKISGDSSSEVRLTLDGNKVTGSFQSGSTPYFVEPARKYSGTALSTDLVVYQEADSLVQSPFYSASDLPGQINYGSDLHAFPVSNRLRVQSTRTGDRCRFRICHPSPAGGRQFRDPQHRQHVRRCLSGGARHHGQGRVSAHLVVR